MRFERLQVKDFFTLAVAGFGFLAVWFAFKDYVLSAVFIVLAALLDFLDGHVARHFGNPNEFGRELDSLSDAVAFGAAPALTSLAYASEPLWIYASAATIYVLAALVRLARFNLYASKGKYYGLPVPAAALLAIVLTPAFRVFLPLLLLALAALMLGEFEVRKPKI